MSGSVLIDPNGIYDDDAVFRALEVSASVLSRARREGRLRFTRKGRRVFYLGRWLLDWFEADAVCGGAANGH